MQNVHELNQIVYLANETIRRQVNDESVTEWFASATDTNKLWSPTNGFRFQIIIYM